jgi:hypothetical protein
MPEQVTKLKLFLASPGDVNKERDVLTKVAGELNSTIASDKNLVLEVVRWETHTHPDLGDDPQAVVNRQIGPTDIFVGVFWHRIGSKTNRAESGTIEEFEIARDLWKQGRLKHLLLYFKIAPWTTRTREEAEQVVKLLDFRKSISSTALVKEFKTVRAFEEISRRDLSNLLLAWAAQSPKAEPQAPVPQLAGTVILARAVDSPAPAAARSVPASMFPRKVISGGHYSALTLRWVGDSEVVFATRGGDVMVATTEGVKPREAGRGGAVPSYLSVRGDRVAVMKYTHLEIYSLRGGDVASVLFEKDAGGSIAEWSPSGEFIAAAGANCIKVFRADLNEIATHHVGGKYGSSAVAWTGDVLWVGLHNGELWRLEPPFGKPEQIVKRQGISCLALRTALASERLACYWYDGRIEIRKNGATISEVQTEPQNKWTAKGPKLGWCLDDTALAVTNGLGAEVMFWKIGSILLRCQMSRHIEALDAIGSSLALGIGESEREVNGEVWVLDLARLPRTFEQPAPESESVRPHLLHADWTPLLDALEDTKQSDTPPDISRLRLSVEPLEGELQGYEERFRNSDAEPGIIREVSKGFQRERRRAERILDSITWLGHQMRLSGYHEREIETCLDLALSFESNTILMNLGVTGYPDYENPEEFVGFTLGCDPADIVMIGLDTADGRGVVAGVQVRFLMQVSELVRMGESAVKEAGVQNPSERDIVCAAAQRFHAFDFLFGWQNQRELWIRYVLPQALARDPRDQIILKHSEIERFGLT